MARKSEVGIEYFPMNSDIIHNPKIKLVVAEFGGKTTWAVLIPLYCKIYREKGYWMDWHDEDSKLLFAQDECKIELSVIEEVVKGCIRRSLFNKRVFDTFGILTSDRIQENYIVAKTRAFNVILYEEFLLIEQTVYKSHKYVTVMPITATLIAKKVTIKPQKEKEITEGEGERDSAAAVTHTPEQKNLFKNFQAWMGKHAPRVNQMKEPLTIDEYLKLRIKFNKETLCNLLLAMQNYKPLLSKSVSANLTILNWSKRENNTLHDQPAQNSNLSEAVKNIEIGNGR